MDVFSGDSGFFVFRDIRGQSWRMVQRPMTWKERIKTLLKMDLLNSTYRTLSWQAFKRGTVYCFQLVTLAADMGDPKKQVGFGDVQIENLIRVHEKFPYTVR